MLSEEEAVPCLPTESARLSGVREEASAWCAWLGWGAGDGAGRPVSWDALVPALLEVLCVASWTED